MLATVVTFFRMIKFSHTLFALPFALIGALLARRGWPEPSVLFWVVTAMVGARTAAMGFNRLVDRRFDAANPRTRDREIPSGRIAPGAAGRLIVAAAGLFFIACWNLNTATLLFAPPALAATLIYSYTKRFTSLSHLVLGGALALAPVGGYLAVAGTLAGYPWWLSLGVVFWVAGFDVLYAAMDVEFDRRAGLHSLPARLGRRNAFRLAVAFDGLAFAGFLLSGLATGLGAPWLAGLAVAAAAMASQHLLIAPTDLRRIQTSFFTLNGVISLTLLAATAVAVAP